MKLREKRLGKKMSRASVNYGTTSRGLIAMQECQRKGEGLKSYLKKYWLKSSKSDEN